MHATRGGLIWVVDTLHQWSDRYILSPVPENKVSEKQCMLSITVFFFRGGGGGGGAVKPLGPPLNNGQPLTAKSAARNGAWPL